MSRYIDADEAEKWLRAGCAYAIRELPSIDIVFCKECKHWDDRRKDDWWSEEGACYLTSRLGYATYRNHDDFCSRGERKESE